MSPRKKNRMAEFQINEISAVDVPAQAHAKIVIMKRGESENVETNKATLDKEDTMSAGIKKQAVYESIAKMYINPMDGAVSFAEVIDLEMQAQEYYAVMDEVCPLIYAMETSLKSIAADSSYDSSQKLNMMRETVEGFMSTLREKWDGMEDMVASVVGKLEEEPEMAMTIKQLQDEVASLTAQLEEAKKASGSEVGENKELETLKGKVDELTQNLEKANKDRDDAIAKASLSDAERDFHASLDAENASEFMKMNAKARLEFMKTAADTDETLTVNGRTVRKSVVGEDAFEIMKAQEERMLDIEKQAKSDREERIVAQLTKRVTDDFDALPGSTDEKVSLLKAVSSLGDAERGTLDKILKAGNDALAGAFTQIGHNDGKIHPIRKTVADTGGSHPFMEKVNDIKKSEKVNGTVAMAEARKRFPDEYAEFAGKDESAA